MQISDKGLLKSQAYVNGVWIDSDDGSTFSVTDPANGETISDVASCGREETRRAIIYLNGHESIEDLLCTITHEVIHHCVRNVKNITFLLVKFLNTGKINLRI